MKIKSEPLPPVSEVKDNEEVRIYRLHLLEENQVKILEKIEELEQKLDEKFNEKITEHEKRLLLLESRNKRVDRLFWVVIIETVSILGFILKAWIGV